MKILETERLLFRNHLIEDKEAYCAMEMDELLRRYVGGAPRKRDDAERRFMNAMKPVDGKLNMWATVLKAENKYIGRCGIYQNQDESGNPVIGEAALGLYLSSGYWGRGLATEAAHALIDIGFNEINLNRIVSMVQIGNDASVSVMEKLGFKLDRTEKGILKSFYHFVLDNPVR